MNTPNDDLPNSAIGRFAVGFGVSLIFVFLLDLLDSPGVGFIEACRQSLHLALLAGLTLGMLAACGKGALELVFYLLEGIVDGMF
jgi:hypothetical protein